MGGYLFIIGLIIVIYFFRSSITLRIKIRKIIKKHPNTISYLSRGVFKRHELIKSLKGKVFDELSNQKVRVNRQRLEKIINQEINKVLKGWRGRLRVYSGLLGAVFCFIAIWVLSDTISNSEVIEKKEVMDKSDENLDKRETAEEKKNKEEEKKNKEEEKKNKNKEEEKKKKNKDEERFNSGINYMNNGQGKKAIGQFEKINKKSERFKKAKTYIRTIKRDQFIEQCTAISYKELQKAPEDYIGEKVHFYGRIYNIQEISGKTIVSLSTDYIDDDYIGDEALILFPAGTSLVEGDYIDIYGEMRGNFSTNQQFISKFLKNKQYSIYYDQRTYFEQAPVLETRVIVDSRGKILGTRF